MAKVAFPSYDVQAVKGIVGGVGAFVTRLARKFREAGDEVSIILATGQDAPLGVDPEWRERYRAWGIDIVEVHNLPWREDRWPDLWTARLSALLVPILRDFDIAYFADWGNVGFETVRTKRFARERMPVCVTVLHGPSNWVRVGDKQYPLVTQDLNLEFAERYAARHSDFVAAPSRAIVDWVRKQGWTFPREPEVLGLPYWPEETADAVRSAGVLKRIVFFGRAETRKGYQLLGEALARLAERAPDALKNIEEVVVLGAEKERGACDWIRSKIKRSRIPLKHIAGADTLTARQYLLEHVPDALVVMPSRLENFPYAVIEASLVPGLNFIYSSSGGTGEISGGADQAQSFEPSADALAAKLAERLRQPLPPERLARYDYEPANRRWLDFHDRVRRLSEGRPKKVAMPAPASKTHSAEGVPAVDVCVAYFNKGRHFPQLIECLENQTLREFRLIAVDDGSTDPDSIAVFDRLANRYASRGWKFIRQENRFVDAARNRAARDATAEYLFMIDADDVCPPETLERLLEAARLSGVDYLVPQGRHFGGDDYPFDRATGKVTAPILGMVEPLGASLIAGLVDSSVLGGSCVLVRRSAFMAVGGYREIRGVAHEDWELHIRLALAGFATDAIGEVFHFQRRSAEGLSRRADEFDAKRRLIETYEARLGAVGLHGMANALVASAEHGEKLQQEVYRLRWLLSQKEAEGRYISSVVNRAKALATAIPGAAQGVLRRLSSRER